MTSTPPDVDAVEVDIYDLIESHGRDLAARLRAGRTPLEDEETAGRLLAEAAGIVGLDEGTVLDHLVRARIGSMVAVTCLLDECDEGSVAAEDAMARLLLAEIRRQGRVGWAVRELVVDAVDEAARIVLASADSAVSS